MSHRVKDEGEKLVTWESVFLLDIKFKMEVNCCFMLHSVVSVYGIIFMMH